jgi:hypothetical protein
MIQEADWKRVKSATDNAERAGERIGQGIKKAVAFCRSKITMTVAVILGVLFVGAFSIAKGMRK